MKLKAKSTGRVYEGTPREIVSAMRKSEKSPTRHARDNRDYMRRIARILEFSLVGKTADEVHENFVKALYALGYLYRFEDEDVEDDDVDGAGASPGKYTREVAEHRRTKPPVNQTEPIPVRDRVSKVLPTIFKSVNDVTPTKRLKFVTCIYDLTKRGSTQHRDIHWMFANSGFVMNLDVPLVVFTDSPDLAAEVVKRRGDRPTEIMSIALNDLISEDRRRAIAHGRLQDNATRTKVTPAYVELMWSKYEMIQRVCDRERWKSPDDATHIGWIDFAIQHIANVEGLNSSIFFELSNKPRVHMLRYFDATDCGSTDYWRNVHGHLAGGLVVGGRQQMAQLANEFRAMTVRATAHGLSPLDEGVLSVIVGHDCDNYTFSYGDYCDILRNHDRVRGGRDHLIWQRQDALDRGKTNHVATIDALLEQLDPPPQVSMAPPKPPLAAAGKRASAHALGLVKEIYQTVRDEPKPFLGLVMIVKNEAHGIIATLSTFKPYIQHWSILDTGSTDGTQDLIRTVLNGIPGTLHEEPFVDFSTSRNRILDLHGEKTEYTIMVDADDMLANGHLLEALVKAADLRGAYLIEIRRDNLSYHLPLLMRTSAEWRYRYRVHEVAGPRNGGGFTDVKIPHVQVRQSRPAQSAEASAARWERDLKLLSEDCAADPREPRILFYLAQTYECLSRPVEALNVYDERIHVGGWDEETYEAKLRRAKILDSLERRSRDAKIERKPDEIALNVTWPVVQAAYIDLYAEKPTRAEPLLGVAQHWYDEQKHPLAFMYAQRAAATPLPTNGLFIDADIYEHRAAYIASISGFYCGDVGDPNIRIQARRCAEQCVRAQPHNDHFRSNWAFYAQSAAELFPGYTEKPIDFVPDDPFVANNPSVFYDHAQGEWLCLSRTTNYRIIDGQYLTLDADGKHVPIHDNPIVTRNWLLRLNPDLDVLSKVELIDETGEARSSYPVHGFEDCRLFRWQDRLYCTATVCDFDLFKADEGPREIVMFTFNPDSGSILSAKPLRGPWSAHAQKNWMPVVDPERGLLAMTQQIVYAAAPHNTQATVATVDRQRFELAQSGVPSPRDRDFEVSFNKPFYGHGRLRGGSQVVRIADDAFLCIVHDVAWTGGGSRIYTHRFVLFNNDFEITKISDPFHFKKLGIEFCAGLALDGMAADRLVASFGVEDRQPYFGTFSLKTVLAKLRSDYVI